LNDYPDKPLDLTEHLAECRRRESVIYGPRGWRRGQPHLCPGCFEAFPTKAAMMAHMGWKKGPTSGPIRLLPCFVLWTPDG
jgi:hypothetical protein